MKIFLSYSASDTPIVESTYKHLSEVGEIKFWDKDKTPGDIVWDSIFKWIDEADLVVVIVSQNTINRAMAVGQEIGRAKAKNKKIIPLVASNVVSMDLGCLHGTTYQMFDFENPADSIKNITKTCLQIKQKNAEEATSFWVIIGILTALFLVGSKAG